VRSLYERRFGRRGECAGLFMKYLTPARRAVRELAG
jgi:hypothetical protein